MIDASNQSVRRRITYSGRVQGVGFRYAACRVAADHDVAGWVRNLPAGQVEVVAEGRPNDLDAFQASLADEMSGYIRGVEASDSPATGEFSQFEVRF
ncbi:MAG: acylphosphatase [Phycisphaerae bacterium]|nr:acylphosphatase [Phycisphaerae bacterium]